MQGAEVPQLATVGQVNGVLKIVDAAALGARLINPAVTMDSVRQRLNFVDRHATRLFAVNILAGFGGEQGSQRVPMVSGRDQNGEKPCRSEEHTPELQSRGDT